MSAVRTVGKTHPAIRGAAFWAMAALSVAISGCAVVAVVSTAATVATTVVSTAVDVGVGAVKVTGKVISKGVDAVSGPLPLPLPLPGAPALLNAVSR